MAAESEMDMSTDTMAFYICTFLEDENADGVVGLSRLEGDAGAGVEEQRQLLRSYVDANPELDGAVSEYIDEKYCGDLFRRPGFNRMIEDVKRGCVQMILMIDVYRMGTEAKMWGNYLDTIFPFLGVRVIILGSNYDSSRRGWKTAPGRLPERRDFVSDPVLEPVLNPESDKGSLEAASVMFRQRRSEEIRAGVRKKWETGSSTAGHAPYGFLRDENVRGGWAIDPEAAKVVRLIFEKAGEGWETRMIADYLNEQQIPPPGIYLERKNVMESQGRKVADSEYLWDTEKIRSVLHRYEYTGAYVHHSRDKISNGTGKLNLVPASQQVILEDAHDAIVSKAEFEKAQAVIRPRSKSRYKLDIRYPLRGMIRCGICGLAMAKTDYGSTSLMYCFHKKSAGARSACCGDYIPLEIIEDSVRKSLCEHGVNVTDDSKLLSVRNSVRESEKDAIKRLTLEEAAARYIETVYVFDAKKIEVEWKTNM